MTRLDLQDRLNYCRRELDFLTNVQTGCDRCDHFNGDTKTCKTFGPVPADFIAQGCDDWEFNDVPF